MAAVDPTGPAPYLLVLTYDAPRPISVCPYVDANGDVLREFESDAEAT